MRVFITGGRRGLSAAISSAELDPPSPRTGGARPPGKRQRVRERWRIPSLFRRPPLWRR